MTTTNITELAPKVGSFQGETWEVRIRRVDAEWEPLTDEKGRKVHGWACLSETPAHMLGKVLVASEWTRVAFGSLPFHVEIFATRDGEAFGALPKRTAHATLDDAVAHARRALAAQGKRYAKKYGAKSA